MKNLIWVVIALALICFALAILGSVAFQSPAGIGGVAAEGLSSACTNLLLLAIVLILLMKKNGQ